MTKLSLAGEVHEELKALPLPKLRHVLSYIQFLKISAAIDPSQLYFWSRRWQAMEHKAEADKRARQVIGDGTLPTLLRELKRR